MPEPDSLSDARSVTRRAYPLPQDHPWKTAILPVVAVGDESVVAIGTGFTTATSGIVIAPAAVAVTAIERASLFSRTVESAADNGPRIGCVIGIGSSQGREIGRLVLVEQVHVHSFTDFALLQLELAAGSGPDALFPILPLTVRLPDAGSRLIVAGYEGTTTAGTIIDGRQIVHDWQLKAYWTSVAGTAQAERKHGNPSRLLLLTDHREFDPGMLGGPIFSVGRESHGLSFDPVCASLGHYQGAEGIVAYGMSLAPAMGFRVAFPEGNAIGSQSLYEIGRKDRLAQIHGLDGLVLSPVDDRYSQAIERPPTPPPPVERTRPSDWLHAHGLELGYYSPGKVPVIRYMPSLRSAARPPAMTAMHERFHMALTTCTAYGNFVCELASILRRLMKQQEFDSSDRLAAPYQALAQCMQELMERSWMVQEAGATHAELEYGTLHGDEGVAAGLRRDLPETYAHAVARLDEIMATLEFPFPRGTEVVRSTVATGLCAATLNTDIIDHFASRPITQASSIIEYLSNPLNHPDERLLLIHQAARADSRLLTRIAPGLVECIAQLARMAPLANSHPEKVRCFEIAGREADRLAQNFVRELGLFPVIPWIDMTADEIRERRVQVRRSILSGAQLDPTSLPVVSYKSLSVAEMPEVQTFDALDHSHEALRSKGLAAFPGWMEGLGAVKLPAGGRLAFSAAPRPHPGGAKTAPAWTCYLASLTLAPGICRFNRLAIELEGISENELTSMLDALRDYSTSLTIPQEAMQMLAENGTSVFQGRLMPLFEYVMSVSPSVVDGKVGALGKPARARVLRDVLPANRIYSVRTEDPDAARLLWFDSGVVASLYHSLLLERGISIDDGPYDWENDDDTAILLAAWMCTAGAIGHAGAPS